ncbi:hypothetical protein [Streptomyces sp. NBC_01334]|uniref:hypothetical protein n=1 Tax=Streptomyces sp. NBC_01334 TaxID=2903827 RepID=UPI002E0FA9C1|nr:hypothetical protein OG736_23885 [Streptomyces sp. NBC_01334]
MSTTQETPSRPPQGRKRLPINESRLPCARRLGEMLQKNCPPPTMLRLADIAVAVPTSVSTVSRAMRAAKVPIWENVEGMAAELYVHRDKIAEPENFPLRETWYATWLAAWVEQGGKPYNMPPPGRKHLPGLAAVIRPGTSVLPGMARTVLRVAIVLLPVVIALLAIIAASIGVNKAANHAPPGWLWWIINVDLALRVPLMLSFQRIVEEFLRHHFGRNGRVSRWMGDKYR